MLKGHGDGLGEKRKEERRLSVGWATYSLDGSSCTCLTVLLVEERGGGGYHGELAAVGVVVGECRYGVGGLEGEELNI